MALSLLHLLDALEVLSWLEHRPVRVIGLTGLIVGGLTTFADQGPKLLPVGLICAGVIWALAEAWFYYVNSD